jgi:hypothetical protein
MSGQRVPKKVVQEVKRKVLFLPFDPFESFAAREIEGGDPQQVQFENTEFREKMTAPDSTEPGAVFLDCFSTEPSRVDPA